MGNTVKMQRASEETNVLSQAGKSSFNFFCEKMMFKMYSTFIQNDVQDI